MASSSTSDVTGPDPTPTPPELRKPVPPRRRQSTARVALPEHDPVARVIGRHPLVELAWRWRVPILVVVATLVGLAIGIRSRPRVFYDDAAITMRYASRIAEGQGWTYNPGDRTNGASAPLYTMVLALLDLIGFEIATAVRLVGLACMSAVFGMVAYLGSRIIGVAAGVFATGMLASWPEFHDQALFGMEGGLAAMLGLGVVIALREDRDLIAGILLGLAVVNKLDAGMLALAVAFAYVGVLKRPPWRLAAAATVVAAPWFVFSTAYFGSPLPQSFTQKQSGQVDNPAIDVPVTWVLEAFRNQQMLPMLALGLGAAALVPWLVRSIPRAGLALAVVVAWPVLHGLAYSLIDLGDRNPWYHTVLYPCLALGAGCLLGAAVGAARRSSGLAVAVTALAMASIAAMAVGLHRPDGGATAEVADRLLHGRQLGEYEAFENARAEAARRLGEIVEPGDVIQTCFGWFAFESPEAVIDETCALNTREDVGPPRWLTTVSFPGYIEPEVPPGGRIVITVGSEVGRRGRVDVIELDAPAQE